MARSILCGTESVWFKNLSVFELDEPFTLTPEEVTEQLAEHAFRPCGGLEPHSLGWAPAMGRLGGELTHAAAGFLLICARREERLLPPAVVRETVEERIAQIESDDFRTVTRKERQRLRDDITFELMPRAFTRSTYLHAYIAPDDGLLVLDTASAKAAEELSILLGRSLGRLGLTPFATGRSLTPEMTRWVAENRTPDGISLLHDCELRDKADEKSIVRCVGQDLTSPEIKAHLQAGKEVERIALSFQERASFALAADMTIRRLRFDAVKEMEHDPDLDAQAQFDLDFAFMTNELRHLLTQLGEIFPRAKSMVG
ncbi:MAG: recombination-associated protein RdgC [Gammaproteobacteria bacterium]|nr:recombination-associated protein RdgC [Gammaproteobacteria bacterium]